MKNTALHARGVVLLAAATSLGVAVAVGVVSPAFAAPPVYSGYTGLTGVRPGATSIPFPVSDQTSVSVDVATGNLLVQTSSLALVGVNAPVRIGQSYNSMSSGPGSQSPMAAAKWTWGLDGAGFLSTDNSGVMVYTDSTGATWSFSPISGGNMFTSPAGLKKDLVSNGGSGWTLLDRRSRQQVVFDGEGRPVSVADRNGNTTAITYGSAGIASVVSSAGPTASRTASFSYDASTFTTTVTQTSGGLSRAVKYVKDASSNLVKIIDAAGKETAFTYYNGGKISQITGPDGQVMAIGYALGPVYSVSQTNTSIGSPGDECDSVFPQQFYADFCWAAEYGSVEVRGIGSARHLQLLQQHLPREFRYG